MPEPAIAQSPRRPRFRRAAEPPAFRITEDDIAIVRLLARHRFLRSIHIAALVGRSLDRVNDRLLRLFHAGYLDRPRAQLDYYPTAGSAPYIYALADRGARLLVEHDGIEFANVEWSRRNREAGRPFIAHQIEVMDFYVALECAMRQREDLALLHPADLVAAFPNQSFAPSNPFALHVSLTHEGIAHRIGVAPDLAFGLRFADGSRRCFMVEIDRGTMPVERSDIRQTSFARKMHAYLTAYAKRLHERHFGWKAFRVLTVTTDERRMQTMIETLRAIRVPHSPGAALFYFATRENLRTRGPLSRLWLDGLQRGQVLAG